MKHEVIFHNKKYSCLNCHKSFKSKPKSNTNCKKENQNMLTKSEIRERLQIFDAINDNDAATDTDKLYLLLTEPIEHLRSLQLPMQEIRETVVSQLTPRSNRCHGHPNILAGERDTGEYMRIAIAAFKLGQKTTHVA